MPYIAPETIAQAKQIDLFSYLQCHEPQELVHYSGEVYTTKTHDSLKISNGKWMWWSRGIGGRTVLDYLIKVKGLSFVEAVDDADDVFQEVFLRYVKKNPVFAEEEHRKAWLIRVTINCSNNFWSSLWNKKTQELNDEILFETKESINLYSELQQLPPKYREVIHLFYYENMSLEEISIALNRKNSTVRTQLNP